MLCTNCQSSNWVLKNALMFKLKFYSLRIITIYLQCVASWSALIPHFIIKNKSHVENTPTASDIWSTTHEINPKYPSIDLSGLDEGPVWNNRAHYHCILSLACLERNQWLSLGRLYLKTLLLCFTLHFWSYTQSCNKFGLKKVVSHPWRQRRRAK